MDRIEFFDRWAPHYDWLVPSVFYQAVHVRLLEFVELPPTAAVLEVGCGTGKLLNRLAQHWPELLGTGLDASAEMLSQAQRRTSHGDRLQFLHGKVADQPWGNQTFDAVFCSISFLHYPDPVAALAAIAQALKPHGRFYLADFVPPPWLNVDVWQSGRLSEGIALYSAVARESLGGQVGLQCDRHAYLLGPVMMTQFSRPPTLAAELA
ncbi:MAG: class I SAM-dependent methyltransferase [Leptolyngbyaceae cyanobacterium]|mgnify:CR=1 FL=1